jgi:hypothetical protein
MKKAITISLLCLVVVLLLYKLANLLAPGSNPYSEKYKLKGSKIEIINSINKLKKESSLEVPAIEIDGRKERLIDTCSPNPPHNQKFYFYFKNENKIFLTELVEDFDGRCFIFLKSIHQGLKLSSWKVVNKDLNAIENKRIKRIFENQIISKIDP